MVYYFSLAGDQERINCLRPEDEIADLPNWFACGEFDNMEAAEQALFPLGLFDAQGCANYSAQRWRRRQRLLRGPRRSRHSLTVWRRRLPTRP